MKTTICLAAALSLAAPAPALACMNGVEPRVRSQPTGDVQRAERLLSAGDARAAFREAGHALRVVQARPAGDARRELLEPRALRVIAVASVRLEGRVSRRDWSAPSQLRETARRMELEWARGVLELLARETDSPIDRAHWGEALSVLGRHAEAVALLEPLSAEDLMPDAHGFAALAVSQRALAHEAEAARALSGCERSAGRRHRAICPSLGSS